MPHLPDAILIQLQREKSILEDEIMAKKERVAEINKLLVQSKTKNVNWVKHTIYSLSKGEPLTTNDIFNYAFSDKRFEIENNVKRRIYIQQLSLSLNRLCKKGEIFGMKVEGHKGKLYGLSDWKDKAEFDYLFNIKKKRLQESKDELFR